MKKLSTILLLIIGSCLLYTKSSYNLRDKTTFKIVEEISALNSLFLSIRMSGLPDNAPATLLIDSPGGDVRGAAMVSQAMVRLNVTCFVRKASSAALQIIMPSCSKIYATSSSSFGFHDSHSMFPASSEDFVPVGVKEALYILEENSKINQWMASWMVLRFLGDANNCSQEMMAYWGNLISNCVGAHIYQNSDFNAEQFNKIWPQPVLEIISDWDFLIATGIST